MSLFKQESDNSIKESFIYKYLDIIWNKTLKGETTSAYFNAARKQFDNVVSEYLKQLKEKAVVLEFELKKKKYQKPYYPLLDIIKERLNQDINFEEYITEAGVYKLQQRVFLDVLNQQTTQRKEEILIEEIDYEKKKIKDSLYKLLANSVMDKPLVIVIKDLQNAQISTLNFIKYLINNDFQEKIMFVFSFAKNKALSINQSQAFNQKYWEAFIEEIELKETVIDFRRTSFSNDDLIASNNKSELNLEEIIDLSNDCFNLLALKQAKQYILAAYNFYKKNEFPLKQKYQIKLFKLLGATHNFLAEDDTALMYYQVLLNYVKEKNCSKKLAEVYRKIATIHYEKYNLKVADKLVKQGLKLALEFDLKQEIFKAYFLIFLIQERWGKYNLEQWQALYDKLINYGEQLEFNNILAKCYISFYEVVEFEMDHNLDYWQKGLEIAKEYNNNYRISSAYQIRGLLYTREKNYDKVLEYYNKSKKIRKKLNDDHSLAFIYNGLGYYRCLMGQYEQAYEQYSKSLFHSQEIKDYHEIGMTCYNLGLTLFLAFEHEKAHFYLEEVIEIIKILKIKGLKYHSRGKIYALLGINYLKSGDLAKAYDCVAKIKFDIPDVGEYKKDDFESFFLEFFTALYYKAESDYQKAEVFFEKALEMLNDVETSIQHIAPRFYYEYGLLFKKIGDKSQAKKIFEQGVTFSEKLADDFYKKLFLKELDKDIEIKYFNFDNNNFNFKWLAESAELKRTLNKLYNQINRVKFLNNLQNILVESNKKELLLKEVMELINQNFLTEISYLYLKEGNKWQNYYQKNFTINDEFNLENNIKDIVEVCGDEELICNGQDKQEINKCINIPGDFNSFLYAPLKSEDDVIGFIVCLTMKNELQFREDDLEIISIASKQLSVVLDKIDLEKKNKELTIQQDIITAIIKILEFHDRYTKGHSESVATLSAKIARKMGLSQEEIDKTYWSGMVHDIGKIMIDPKVLNKPSSLTDEEYELIQKHPEKGYQVLETSSTQSLKSIAKYILHHHERWDGKGYPLGLKGDEIPFISQILNVADAWDAMTTDRAYRKGLPEQIAIKELKDNKGTQFSPQVVDVALEILANKD